MKKVKKFLLSVLLSALFVLCVAPQTEAYCDNSNKTMFCLIEEKIGSNYEIEYLYGPTLEKDFVLAKGENCYLIYDLLNKDFTEYSLNSSLEIYNYAAKKAFKVYAGPSLFYEWDNNNLKDLSLKVSLDEEFCNRANELGSNRYLGNEHYIEFPCYYENLVNNIPSNPVLYSTACSFVSIGMLLCYYDTFFNDNFIDEIYDKQTYDYNSYELITPSIYTESPGAKLSFEEYLMDLASQYNLCSENPQEIYIQNMDLLLTEYFRNKGLSIVYQTGDIYTNHYNFAKAAIDNGNPVIMRFDGPSPVSNSDDDIQHAIVAYGYTNDSVICNFGWKNRNYNAVYVNPNYINRSFYFDYYGNHVCSDNYLWQADGCTGYMCPCGNKHCNHEITDCQQCSSMLHERICCACGYSYNEEHNFALVNSQWKCLSCGYIQCNHSYQYDNYYNSAGHRMRCTICGETKMENHSCLYYGGKYHCTTCPYTSKFIINPTSNALLSEIENLLDQLNNVN